MKISKSSWHYRFIDFFMKGDPPVNLCSYFWTLVHRLFLFICLATFVIHFVLAVIGVSWFVIYSIFDIKLPPSWLVRPIVTIVSGAGFGIALGLLFALWQFLSLRVFQRRRKKQPSLIVEFIKAKKQKHCPLLEIDE